MDTRRIGTVGIFGLALLSGCGEASTGPTLTPAYFPLEVGNTWTYAPENPLFGDPFEWVVSERQDDTVRLARPPGGSHPGPVILLDRRDEIDLLLPTQGPVPFYRFSVGSSWVHRDPWECDDGPDLATVVEPNPVVTPAGTFEDCIRVERRTAATCTDAGTMMEWWAPGVGLVKWEELNFYAGGPLAFYLTDYTVE